MTWQPIDTYRAGVDAIDVLVAEQGVVGEARYHADERGWYWAGNDPTDSWGRQVYPDHWHPLPSPPTVEGGK